MIRDRFRTGLPGRGVRMYLLAGLAAGLLMMPGCRGATSEKPPIHLNPNMDNQEKYKAQSESDFFADGLTMRPPVEGTVARGELRDDTAFYIGRDVAGDFLAQSPVQVTDAAFERGRERFGIYCVVCHGVNGDGQGEIMRYKYPIPPTSFHLPKVATMNDGEIFSIISNGVRNMPSYKEQISVADRWLIVAYVRELQRQGPPPAESKPAQAESGEND
ncbi:MAG: cytochrome c [Candidatus Neomarinimicrobiota bacterium]